MTVQAATPQPTAKPDGLIRAMPSWVYDNAALSRLEYDRLIRTSWQVVCHISDIPKPGDFTTVDLGRDSVVAIRGRNGAIGTFLNVCRHRAARIFDGQGSCGASIRCPYHGWAYDFEGNLRAMPEAHTFPGLDKSEFGLHAVRMDMFFGFVLVCLDGNPTPMSKLFKPLIDIFEPYQIENMEPMGAPVEEAWDADWKIAMDNYLESYHVPVGHPGLFRLLTPDYVGQVLTKDGIGYSYGEFRPEYSDVSYEREYQELAPKVATHLPEDYRRRWWFISSLPNLGIDIFPDQMDFFQVLPRGPGKCVIRSGNYALPDNRPEMQRLRDLNARINQDVMAEDAFLCRRVQQGLATTGYTPGPLSAYENCVAQFHDILRERIPETCLPHAPAQFA
jgi:phenylpropionate dioxygenase-like ring-hydroxylating dioxygenase large terminal subunit